MISESQIGNKIKECRLKKKMTLQQLAEKINLTRGYLSRIENSKKGPALSTLFTIVDALGVRISEFLEEIENKESISLVKKLERPIIVRDGTAFGYSYEALAHTFSNKYMEPYVLNISARSKRKFMFQHKGQELLFLLEGEMNFFHGDKEFIIGEGDCLYYDAGIPHAGVSLGNRNARCLVVICSPDKLGSK